MATKSATAAPISAFGEITRFAELRQRLFFLIGALIVYRIGTFIPVPGIDPIAYARQTIRDPSRASAHLSQPCEAELPRHGRSSSRPIAPAELAAEIAHIGGGLERNFVRLIVGDRVTVELTPKDLTRGRILRKV